MEFIKNLFETVLEFIKINRYWFELGAVCLVVSILLIMVISLSIKSKRERRYNAEMLYQYEKSAKETTSKISDLEGVIEEKNSEIRNLSEAIDVLQSDNEAVKEDYKNLETKVSLLEVDKSKLASDLKALNKVLKENEEAYHNDLQAVIKEKVTLAEEYSKHSEAQAERIRALSAELDSQREINLAFTVAVKEISKSNELVTELKRKPKYDLGKTFEEMSREELLLSARNLGLKGLSKMRKEDLINALNEKLNKK